MHDSRDAINNMTATTYEFTALDIIDKQNRFFSLSELRKGEKIYIKITEQKLIFDPTTVKEENIGDARHTEFTSNSHLSILPLLILSTRQITSSACSGISTSTSFIKNILNTRYASTNHKRCDLVHIICIQQHQLDSLNVKIFEEQSCINTIIQLEDSSLIIHPKVQLYTKYAQTTCSKDTVNKM